MRSAGDLEVGDKDQEKGVLREAWRVGLMSAEDLARTTDFAPVRASTVLRGR